jgi:hypothetical protein
MPRLSAFNSREVAAGFEAQYFAITGAAGWRLRLRPTSVALSRSRMSPAEDSAQSQCQPPNLKLKPAFATLWVSLMLASCVVATAVVNVFVFVPKP